MIIKDELYGTIEFTDIERKIIDTPDFQRLRYIKQMSFTNLVYPGANHTRFEHSLGCAHLSEVIAKRLELDPDTIKKVKLFGLLHDIGHVAFSHEGEDIVSKYIGDHEKLGEEKIRKGEIADILSENYKPSEILDLAHKKEGQIIESDIGSDRMDYLKRDALNTGVAYGVIDIDRIVHTLEMYESELVISEGGLEAAESLLVGRFMMFSTVYLHRTVRIATAMLYQAINLSLKDGAVEAEDFIDLTDEQALIKMKQSVNAKRYVESLQNRSLYKEILSLDTEIGKRKASQLREKLEGILGCDVLFDWPHPFFKPVGFKVKTSEGLEQITELSDLVRSLKKSEKSRMRILMLVPSEHRETAENKLKDKLSEVLHS
jgi:HD superfamily phosphohydrolase